MRGVSNKHCPACSFSGMSRVCEGRKDWAEEVAWSCALSGGLHLRGKEWIGAGRSHDGLGRNLAFD